MIAQFMDKMAATTENTLYMKFTTTIEVLAPVTFEMWAYAADYTYQNYGLTSTSEQCMLEGCDAYDGAFVAYILDDSTGEFVDLLMSAAPTSVDGTGTGEAAKAAIYIHTIDLFDTALDLPVGTTLWIQFGENNINAPKYLDDSHKLKFKTQSSLVDVEEFEPENLRTVFVPEFDSGSSVYCSYDTCRAGLSENTYEFSLNTINNPLP